MIPDEDLQRIKETSTRAAEYIVPRMVEGDITKCRIAIQEYCDAFNGEGTVIAEGRRFGFISPDILLTNPLFHAIICAAIAETVKCMTLELIHAYKKRKVGEQVDLVADTAYKQAMNLGMNAQQARDFSRYMAAFLTANPEVLPP